MNTHNINNSSEIRPEAVAALDSLLLETPVENLCEALSRFEFILKHYEGDPEFLEIVFDRFCVVLDKLVIPGLVCLKGDVNHDLVTLGSSCDIVCWFFNACYYRVSERCISSECTVSLLSSLWTSASLLNGLQNAEGWRMVADTLQVILETAPSDNCMYIFEWLKSVEPESIGDPLIHELFFLCLKSFISRVAMDQLENITMSRSEAISNDNKTPLSSVLKIYQRWKPEESTAKGEYILDRELSILKKSMKSDPRTVVKDEMCETTEVQSAACYKYYLSKEDPANAVHKRDPDWIKIFEQNDNIGVIQESDEDDSVFEEVEVRESASDIELERTSTRKPIRKLKFNVKRIFKGFKQESVPYASSGQISPLCALKYKWLDWFWDFWYPVDDTNPRIPHSSRIFKSPVVED